MVFDTPPKPHITKVMKRKRKAENQGAQGMDKKTNNICPPGRPDIEAYFTRACSLQTTTVLPGTMAGHVGDFKNINSFSTCSGIHGFPTGHGYVFQSIGEQTDDDSSEWSSSDVACYAPWHRPVSPSLSWSDTSGIVGLSAASGGTAHGAFQAPAGIMMTANNEEHATLLTGYHCHGPNNPTQFRNMLHDSDGLADGAEGVAVATAAARVQWDDASRGEMDEWGWFVDAAEPRHE